MTKEAAAPPRRRRLRRALLALAIVVVFLAAFGSLLPTLLSSSSGRDWLFERVSAAIPGRLSAAAIDLNWGAGQKVESLRLEDAQGGTVARARLVSADVSLTGILRGEYGTGRVVIEGLEIDLVLDEEGRLNLAGAIAAPDAREPEPIDLPALLREFVIELPPSLKADVELRDARVSLRGPGIETPLEMTSVAGTLRLERVGAPIEFDLGGTLGRGSRAALKARLEGFDKEGRLRASEATLSLELDAELADDAEASVAMVRRLLGESARLAVSIRTSKSGASFELEAKSPRLEFAAPGRIEVADGQAPRLHAQGARADYVMTPAALRELSQENAAVTLAGDVDASLTIDSLEMPLDGSSIALEARAAIADGRIDVTIGEIAESLAWSGWSASIRKQAAGESAAVELHGRVEEGEVDVTGTLRLPAEGDLRASIKRFPLARIDRVMQSFTGKQGLLVDLLGPSLELEGSIRKERDADAIVGLRVDTQRLKLTAPLVLDLEHRAVRAKDVEVRYTLAPSIAPALGLEKDLPLRLDVSSFAGSLAAFDPKAIALQAKLEVGATRLGGAKPVDIGGASVEIGSESLSAGLSLAAECRVGGGRATALGKLSNLWDEEGALQLARARGRLRLDIENLPAATLDAALGDVLDGRLTFEGGGEDAQLDVTLDSNRLHAALPLMLSDGRIRLRETGRLRYTLTPETAWRFLPARNVDAGIDRWTEARLQEPVEITAELRSADAPADGRFPLDDVKATGTVSLGPVRLGNVPRAGTLTLTGWSAAFEGESLAAVKVRVEGALESSRVSLGAPVRIVAQGDADAAALTAEAPDRLRLGLAVVREGEFYRLREPATLDLEVRRDLLGQLDVPADWLRGALRAGVVIDSLHLPRDGDWSRGKASFGLTVPEAMLRVDGRDVTLRELGLQGTVAAQVKAELKAKLGDGDLYCHIDLADRRDDAPLVVSARLQKFPTGLLGGNFSRYVGETVEVSLKADMPRGFRAAGGAVSLVASAPHLELDMELEGRERWQLSRPASATWTMTPASFRTLMPDSKLQLLAPAVLSVKIPELTLPAGADSIDHAALRARAEVPDVRLRAREGGTLQVRALALDVQASDLRKPIEIGLDGRIEGGGKPGRLEGKVVVEYLGSEREPVVFAEDRVSVRADLELGELPVPALDALLAMDGYLPAVLGETAGGTCSARLVRGRGPFDITLDSGNFKASIAGQWTPGALLLRRPVEATLTHSEALADKVLPKLGPLFDGIVGTEVPISVVVPHEGFRVPRPFDFASVDVPFLTLDVGKVTMENKTLIRIVKQLAQSNLPEKTDAWFTPVEVSLQGGVIRYKRRLDLLLDKRYHFSTWGEADLVRGRIDMVLGVMPETLKEILRMKGVGQADTLRIDIEGPLARPKIDLGRVVTDLAVIRAKDDALRNLPELARPFAEAALQKLLRKTLQGPPPLRATADPLPWDVPPR